MWNNINTLTKKLHAGLWQVTAIHLVRHIGHIALKHIRNNVTNAVFARLSMHSRLHLIEQHSCTVFAGPVRLIPNEYTREPRRLVKQGYSVRLRCGLLNDIQYF